MSENPATPTCSASGRCFTHEELAALEPTPKLTEEVQDVLARRRLPPTRDNILDAQAHIDALMKAR